MADDALPRRLASIVAVDMAGYSRRTEADEAGTIGAVAALRARVTAAVGAHGGRVFNTAGDGFMLEFPTASGALAAAEQIAAAGDPPVRVGVHLGEVSPTDSGDLLGHGVNVAARIQQMASPGAVLVSGEVKRTVRGPLGERLKPQGSVKLDKMNETLPVFALAAAKGGRARGRRFKIALPVALGAAAAVVLAAALAAWLGRGLWERSSPREPRVAVMTFDTLGQAPGLHDFATGLQDQILGVMSANEVHTVSRADSQTLRGGDAALQRLGVTLLLDGTIQENGKSLDVRVHLDDPRQHLTLWSTSLDGPASAAADLQLRVAAKITSVLLCADGMQRSPSAPREADTIALFFRACDLSQTVVTDQQRMEQAMDALRQVTVRSPGFAKAHASLASTLAIEHFFAPEVQPAARAKEALAEAHRALQIDPNDGDAWFSLSMLQPVSAYGEREKLLVQGISRAPGNTRLLTGYRLMLDEVGRLKEAADYADRAAAKAPLDEWFGTAKAYQDAAAGQFEAAKSDIVAMRRTWPSSGLLHLYAYYIAIWSSDWASARAALDQPNTPGDPSGTGLMRRCAEALPSRDPAKVAAVQQAVRRIDGANQVALRVGIQCLAQLGKVDEAFQQAERFRPDVYGVDGSVTFFLPSTASMRRDRRFMPLMARIGLVDYWRTSAKWPDFCSEPGLPYDCKAEAAKAAGARHG
jgi:class 3 adenylate cyclase/TolB-like protein